MIRKLDNTVYENSKLIWKVFQLSYSVEARILNAENFPPLKRSIESIQEKSSKGTDFIKKIDIEITNKNDYIRLTITDNVIGFSNTNLDNILKPYFTTKIKGSGLGLSIVNKIINDHNGNIKFIPKDTGAKIVINFSKNVDRNINH